MKLVLKEDDEVIFEAESDTAGWTRLMHLAQTVIENDELFKEMEADDESDE